MANVPSIGSALEDLARRLGIGAPFGSLAETAYRRLCELGHAASNESKIIEVARARFIE